VLAACAVAPDLDLLLRFIDGVNHHRGPSHSLGMALLVAILGLAMGRLGFGVPGGLAMGAAWASHVLLDYLGIDTVAPYGEMALWPLSREFFIAPVPFFYDVPRSFSPEAIRHNLIAVAIEVIVLAPVAWLCWPRAIKRARP
jgi:inner membrane protein